MTIDEFIKNLEAVKKTSGNIKVAIQYRDDGGCYFGCEDPDFIVVDDPNYDYKYASITEPTLML